MCKNRVFGYKFDKNWLKEEIFKEGAFTRPPGTLTRQLEILTRLSGTFTRPSGKLTRPLGTLTRLLRMLTRPLGMFTRPLGMLTRPSGTLTRLLGMLTRPLGILTRPLGTFTRLLGMLTRPLGTFTRSLGMLTRLSGNGVLFDISTNGWEERGECYFWDKVRGLFILPYMFASLKTCKNDVYYNLKNSPHAIIDLD